MTRLLLPLIALSTVLSAAFLGTLVYQGAQARGEAARLYNDAALARHWQARAIRWEARADTLYREVRVYITGADSLATMLRLVEGQYSQCAAYQF